MSEYRFEQISFSCPARISSDVFLWVWNPDKIPPHIGVSVGKDYFSLTYREVEHKLTLSQQRRAKRSQIPLLLIRLPQESVKEDVATVFANYRRAMVGGPTCLSPLKQLLDCPKEVKQLAHLLQFLEEKHGVLEVFALHLDESYDQLPKYSISQIMHRIEELNDVKR